MQEIDTGERNKQIKCLFKPELLVDYLAMT